MPNDKIKIKSVGGVDIDATIFYIIKYCKNEILANNNNDTRNQFIAYLTKHRPNFEEKYNTFVDHYCNQLLDEIKKKYPDKENIKLIISPPSKTNRYCPYKSKISSFYINCVDISGHVSKIDGTKDSYSYENSDELIRNLKVDDKIDIKEHSLVLFIDDSFSQSKTSGAIHGLLNSKLKPGCEWILACPLYMIPTQLQSTPV